MLYRFGAFELDPATAELRVDGKPRALEPQVFDLLRLLVEHRGRLVTRDELVAKVWNGRIVSDAAVSSRVKAARRALGDDGVAQRLIRTIHGRGFRFVGEVTEVEDAGAPACAGDTQPTIAVLAFRRLDADARHAALALALPHELIVGMSRLRWLRVTARGSSFRLDPLQVDLAGIARLLGVRYVLSGTVECAGQRVVVAVKLSDTRDARLVWADRFAGPIDEVHAIRETIQTQTLVALEIRIPLHEASRARLIVTDSLDAWSAYHLGLQHLYRFSRDDNARATELFRRALALDPNFARAHAGLSFVHFQTAFMRHTDDVAGESDQARRWAERGVELDPLDPFVNFAMGRTFWLRGDLEGGLPWLERSTVISPSYAQGIYARAWTEALAERPLEGRGHVDQAMRLSPLDPMYYAMLGTRAFTHLAVGEDAAAARWAGLAARAPGAHVLIAMIAAAMHALAGDAARAAGWAANVRERDGALRREDFFRSFPIRSSTLRSRISAALQRLGF